MSRHANVEKNRFGTWFLFVVFGFCWMILYLWIRVPKVLSGEKTLGTLCGSIPIPIWTPRSRPERRHLEPVPLLRWDDDDRWETVSNADVCRNVQSISNKLHENVWTQVHKVGKSHVTWLFSLVMLGLWSMVLYCTAAIARWWSKMEPKETLSHKQSISEGTHDPWKDRVFCAQVPNLVVVWILVGTCLDLNWMSLDLSCFKR